MRLAWFSPMPPVPSGIAACSAQIVTALAAGHGIDVFVDEPVAKLAAAGAAPGDWRSAHEFPWRHRAEPYDLTVFQLGNSSHHDFLWPYLFRYPGLAVLHDGHLHHARAAALLRTRRRNDYRAEFAASHPDSSPDLAELAVAGFDSHLYYSWPMRRLVIQASRLTVVHAALLAADINEEMPGAGVGSIRLGHGELVTDTEATAARAEIRPRLGLPDDAVVFGVFGGLTPDKRIAGVLEAFAAILPYAPDAHLLLAGAPAAHYDVAADVRRRGLDTRVHLTGYLASERELTRSIAACDVALCLRWPTAREVSGPWLRALAAGRPTVVTDLAHLADVPSLDPRSWTLNGGGDRAAAVTVAVDIMDEAHSLRLAMRRLAADPELRATLGAAGRAWWQREHSPDRMIEDYRRVLAEAHARPVPRPRLPPHLLDDGEARLRTLLETFGVPDPLGDLTSPPGSTDRVVPQPEAKSESRGQERRAD